MSFIYTRSDLKSRINAGIQNRIGMVVDADEMVNDLVRDLYLKTDLRSAKRRTALTPDLVGGIFPYNCPTDLKGDKIIDIPTQAKGNTEEFKLTTAEEFRRHNGTKKGEIAIDDYNGQRVLYIASDSNSKLITIAELDTLASGASSNWLVFGDGETLAKDDADFINGAGSLKWNISSAGGTTAGIYNANITSYDISDYLGGTSSYFVYTKINSVTNITSYSLRFGSSSTVYHTKTVTTQHDGTTFVAGWNLLRFDVSSLTDTGTPDDTAITYHAIFMTKDAGKVSETDYKFDWLVLAKGEIHNINYYSTYGWQSSAAAYKQNSTSDTDLLVANEQEYALIIKQGIAAAAVEADLSEVDIKSKEARADKAYDKYVLDNPSEAQLQSTNYYDYDDPYVDNT